MDFNTSIIIPTNHPIFPGIYRKIGLHPGILENFPKCPGNAALAHGPDVRAFGLPVVCTHIATLDLH